MNLLRVSFASFAIAAAVSGCYASVEEPAVYAEADTVPADITIYPHTVYDGRVVYYYGDRWWYSDGGRWAYYRHEPEPLNRHRRYVQQAPPAPRVYTQQPVYSAPHVTSGTVEAPPAVRVR